MPNIDLTNITLEGLVFLTVIVAAIDIIGSILAAIVKREFNLAFVAVWLESHGLKRVLPIFAFAWLGHGVTQLGVPAIPALFDMAVAGLTAYLLETVASLIASSKDASPPVDVSPVPPPV